MFYLHFIFTFEKILFFEKLIENIVEISPIYALVSLIKSMKDSEIKSLIVISQQPWSTVMLVENGREYIRWIL